MVINDDGDGDDGNMMELLTGNDIYRQSMVMLVVMKIVIIMVYVGDVES
jgi:hypothetical protein